MTNNKASESNRNYVTVFRGKSAPCFLSDSELRVKVNSEFGPLLTTFRTRYVDKGLPQLLIGDLWMEARGPAPNLENAVSEFGGVLNILSIVISFSTNAAIGDMEPELVFEDTKGIKEKDFLQSLIPGEASIMHLGRKINTEVTGALIDAIETHPNKWRITRAITQYMLALRHWRWGHETLSTAHLYMGIEALTAATIRHYKEKLGLNDEQLAKYLGIDSESINPHLTLNQEIDIEARKKWIFQNDIQCYRDAKAASDGFEHGFMPFGDIRNKARATRDKTALFFREAILDLLSIKDEHKQILKNPPYDKPLGHWPVVKYVRGKLIGDSDVLALKGNPYPILSWRSTITEVKISESGDYNIKTEEKLTPQLGEGILFKFNSFEVWAP